MPVTSEADWDDVDEESSLRSALCVISTLSSSLWSAQVSPALVTSSRRIWLTTSRGAMMALGVVDEDRSECMPTSSIRRQEESLLHRPLLDRGVSVREWP